MLLLATAFLAAACMHVGDFDAVKGSGTVKSEIRQITGFTKVSLEGAMDVFIVKGESESVRIEADDNLLKLIETKVDGDELEISSTEELEPSQTIKVYVTTRALEGMSIAGSGDMVTQSPFVSKAFAAAIAGSGDIKADVQAEVLDASIAGSGDINIKGSAGKTEVDIAGSGSVNGIELVTRAVDVNIAGSGNCQVHASEVLTANIMGSGSVYYRGEPKINQSVMGSGSITRK